MSPFFVYKVPTGLVGQIKKKDSLKKLQLRLEKYLKNMCVLTFII